jgi:hypothetical protein
MSWVEHVALLGEKKTLHKISIGKLRERDHLEDIGLEV